MIPLYYSGPFGRAVAQQLAEAGLGTAGEWPGPQQARPGFTAGTAVAMVVCTGRDLPNDFDALDERAHAERFGWLPVSFDHPNIRIGPAVTPGRGACFRCHQIRALQHASDHDIRRAVRDAYAADPDLGPTGQLSSHVAVAAALTRLMLAAAAGEPPGWAPGTTVRWHASRQHLSSYQVIGVHGCPRCGVKRRALDRSPLVHLEGPGSRM